MIINLIRNPRQKRSSVGFIEAPLSFVDANSIALAEGKLQSAKNEDFRGKTTKSDTRRQMRKGDAGKAKQACGLFGL